MLVNWHPAYIYLVCGKTDMRKDIDGLAMVIAENYGLELYSNSLFLFWDGESFIMLYKRFENGRLSWPRNSNEAKELSAQQLDWLLQGLNPLPIRKIITTRQTGGLHIGYKPIIKAGVSRRWLSLCSSQNALTTLPPL